MEKCRVALYMRVSTDEQTTDNQELRLQEICGSRQWEVVDIYRDIISGSRSSRPELDRMLKDARRNRFNTVLSVKVDRISRSLRDLLKIAGELGSYNIRLSFTDQDLDISSSQGRLMFQILGAFGEYEREMIVDRTKAGLRRAKRQGKKLGRPKLNGMVVQRIRNLREEGLSYRKISKQVTYHTQGGQVRHVSISQISEILNSVQKRGREKSGVLQSENEGVQKTDVLKTVVSDTDRGGVPETSVIGTEEADQ